MEKDFVSYEYKTVDAKACDRARITDMYEAFGWEVFSVSAAPTGKVRMSLRRDRKQKHRSELVKLERQAASMLDSIKTLERSASFAAKIFAYIFGVFSALVLGGGMCLVMLTQNNVAAFAGGIVLGVIGLVLCGINYPIYAKTVSKRAEKILPAIDEGEEEFANILEKGNELLRADLI